MYLRYPLDNIWFSRGFTSTHKGVDIGWFTAIGEHMPIYAPGDGTVVAAVDGYDNTYHTGVSNWGNYVKIYHGKNADGKEVYTLQAHMKKGSICVKPGDKVKQGQQIGRMNDSGYSRGSHDHSEVYVGGASTAYRVNPVDWLYLYPGQYCDPDTKKDYGVKEYKAMEYIGNPVERNTAADQVEVLISGLRVRKRPELNDAVVLGYINLGFYNVLETRDMTKEASNGYLWYRIADGMWIASKEGEWTKFYRAGGNPEPVPTGGNSPLVAYTKISPHKNSPRNNEIRKITIHHMASNLTVEACGNVFQSRQASSNYGVGGDGRIGMYVEEKDRSWCSSNGDNDHQAITIEVANDGGEPDWHVSNIALTRCIELCIDVCKRNGLNGLKWTGDRSGTLTMHKMFTATACPGPYLEGKMPWIAETVSKWVNNTEAAVLLKVGFMSAGDMKQLCSLLDLKGIAYNAADGFVTTEQAVDGGDRAAVEVMAELMGVPCEVVTQPAPEPEPVPEPDKPDESEQRIAELEAEIKRLESELAAATKRAEDAEALAAGYKDKLAEIHKISA